jgi:hypothetical protein
MTDYVVIWNGRGAMPHQEQDAEYWRTKAAITDHAIDLTGKRFNRLKNCACGRVIKGSGRKKCWSCLNNRIERKGYFRQCVCGRRMKASSARCRVCQRAGRSSKRQRVA